MLNLKLKQAETALVDGRLDEAYTLLNSGELREHRRGQTLIGRLSRALAQRSQEHLEADRLVQASNDCRKAETLGGNLPEVGQLRRQIKESLDRQQLSQHRREQILNQAREHLEKGRLSRGEALLAQVGTDEYRARELLRQAAVKRDDVNLAIRQIEKAIEQDHWAEAVAELLRAKQLQNSHDRIAQLSKDITDKLTRQVTEAFNVGRLDRSETLLGPLNRLAGQKLQVKELFQALGQCRKAYQLIESGQHRQAFSILQRTANLLPAAKWIKTTIDSCEKIAQGLETLQVGPLGLLDGLEPDESLSLDDKAHPSASKKAHAPRAADKAAGKTVLPKKFMIQVDGVGSFPVFSDNQVKVGPISCEQVCDLPLMAEPNLPWLTIERVEEDYFVRSDRDIVVNDKPTRNQLLNNGDRVALSQRCRFRFRRPNAASTTAIISLAGTRMARADVRDAILLDREIIIAPGPAGHIRCDLLPGKIVLFLRNGQLFCRGKVPLTAANNKINEKNALEMGKPITIGNLTMIITEF
ncbi:MAG: hypothetical protein KAR11_07400 [Phycisphaerae bacterium]|nr:hypothetical protein [Phycisphaerae bacterium]